MDWAERFPSLETPSPFAWYDMAVGLRAYRLGYLVDAALRSGAADGELAVLVGSAALHAEALADEKRFAGHSNHGFYQAMGALALARRLPELSGMEVAGALAGARLRRLVSTQFTDEGVHVEHSPGYHLLVLDALERIIDSGLSEDPLLGGIRDLAEESLAWFVQPDGRLAMLGDTGYGFTPTVEYADEHLRFVVSRGREGRPPSRRLAGFPGSGYVVMRDRWPEGPEDFASCSYLAQMCAFHSRAHKHADDLAFVWYDRGHELVVDSGRYGFVGKTKQGSDLWRQGFNYSDRSRVYVESTRAHNTVEIDGRSYQRRDSPAYGSALLSWGDQSGVLWSQSHAAQHASVHHRRLLVLRPGEWLLVVDDLEDDHGAKHRYDQRFHFAPELDVETDDGGVRVSSTSLGTPLHVVSLGGDALVPPVRGQEEPELLGWTSRRANELVALSTAAFRGEGVAHRFVTLLAFGERPAADEPPPAGRSRTRRTRNLARGLRPPRGGVHLRYRSAAGQLPPVVNGRSYTVGNASMRRSPSNWRSTLRGT